MELNGIGALVAGGASGLGEATARELAARGARVAIVDLNEERGPQLAEELGGLFTSADVSDEERVSAAVDEAVEAFGGLRVAVSCAGIGWAERTVGKEGPAKLAPFETVVRVNLIGTYNVLRLSAAAMAKNDPGPEGERGVVVMTASIAAFDGQIGQTLPACSTPRCSRGSPRRPARRSASRSRSPRGWGGPRSTPSSPARSPRTR
jgi:NAD(P)-dependent dehydrogenase (short-subunit alcohol dehydrogenase family)